MVARSGPGGQDVGSAARSSCNRANATSTHHGGRCKAKQSRTRIAAASPRQVDEAIIIVIIPPPSQYATTRPRSRAPNVCKLSSSHSLTILLLITMKEIVQQPLIFYLPLLLLFGFGFSVPLRF